MPSSQFLHAVSLPEFFADGFALATSSSPSSSPQHPTGCEARASAATTAMAVQQQQQWPRCAVCVGPTAGTKRARSLGSLPSTHGITPSSDHTIDSTDANIAHDADVAKLRAIPDGDSLLLLAPAATSLFRMEPCGSWSFTSQPGVTDEGDTVACAEAHQTGDLATLLHAVLQQCYRTEDELQKRWREEEEERERAGAQQEDAGTVMARGGSTSPSSPFERMVDHILAQKRRRRHQSQRLESQMRDIARVKELPLIVEDAVCYAHQIMEWCGKSGNSSSSSSSGGCGGGSVCHAEANVVNSEASSPEENPITTATGPVCAGTTSADTREGGQMLYAKFPPPLFRTSSFAAGVARLLRWVRTWQRASPTEAASAKTSRGEQGDGSRSRRDRSTSGMKGKGAAAKGASNNKAVLRLESASRQRQGNGGRRHLDESESISSSSSSSLSGETMPKESIDGRVSACADRSKTENSFHKRSALQRYRNKWVLMADKTLGEKSNSNRGGGGTGVLTPNAGSPLGQCDEVEYGLTSDHVMYDEYGNRLRSVRLARKMAEQRAQEEEVQKMREQRRGYFARADEITRATRRALFNSLSDNDSDGTSDDANDDVTNIAVLHGPCGVGKTAIVYLVAEILGYRVVEMNTSVRRCPKNIDRLLSELTRSRRLSGLAAGKAVVSIEDELKKLKSEHAAAAAAVAVCPKKTSQKKSNVISAKAVAAFFKPRVKAAPSDEFIHVDVDHTTDTSKTETKTAAAAAADVEVIVDDGCKHGRNDAKTNTALDVAVAPAAGTAASSNGGREGATQTLLLFEDADVILGDEAMKPFYAAVRDLAQRSKVPIVVTVSSPASVGGSSGRSSTSVAHDPDAVHVVPMGAAQVAHFLGKQTPFTGIEPMARSTLFAQLLVVAAVERGLLSLQSEVAVGCASSVPSFSEEGEQAVGAVVVRDVAEFQRLADALRREVYGEEGESQYMAAREHHTDMRQWLNRLHYLLLEEQWPSKASSVPQSLAAATVSCDDDGGGDDSDSGKVTCILPTHVKERGSALEACNAQSEWDTCLGRVLRAPICASPAVPSSWEYHQFQYAEEIAAAVNGSDTWGDNLIGEMRSNNNNNNNGDPPQLSLPVRAVLPPEGLTDVLRKTVCDVHGRCKAAMPFDGVRDYSTTSDRLDAFGGWWRRTRRADAAKLFVAARSADAYEDIIGFGSLLQQQQQPSGAGKSVSG
ncbi:hypothetical protein DQ04_01891030 [Trypanosoma grayi]|uniref:hypothetical protein n=1 Tax=Trypanosoma grayi TaxID=71804 RepID=UPI0004F4597C|nr:hypothetical protein DQ04_01891030 [Trypanosoma grayi]KEG12214.1 hypothetical protein DQ04_01891030 [Trypanosoma grayi]